MKKIFLTLVVLAVMAVKASAMSYSQARDQALFLTDKMAYELNLNDEQYEAAYEINLDYLMRINTYDDLYGAYWTQRNLDLSYILLDWQYRDYLNDLYFYRPLYFNAGVWHFRIYARYPRRDYFYFGCPDFYAVYRGGHSWRSNGGSSWYYGPDFGQRPGVRFVGMRDNFNRGDYGRGVRFDGRTVQAGNNGSWGAGHRSYGSNAVPSNNNGWGGGSRSGNAQGAPQNNHTFGFGGSAATRSQSNLPQSSTRTTVNRNQSTGFGSGNRTSGMSTPRRTFQPGNIGGSRSTTPTSSRPTTTFSRPSTTFSRPSNTTSAPSFGGSRIGTSTRSSAPARTSGSFGGGNVHTGGGHFGN